MNQNMFAKIGGKFHRIGFAVKKHSPELLVGFGIAGAVASAIMACKATTKISSILEKTKEDLEPIRKIRGEGTYSEEYTEEDSCRDLAIVYAQTGYKFIKLYAPSVILGALSIAEIVASTDILRKRNIALAAAYATVDGGFKRYRERVIERFGKDVDHELKYNLHQVKVEEKVTDDDGKEQTVENSVTVADDPSQYSEYARFFDDGCDGWSKDSEYNLAFLNSQQCYLNDRLKSRGYLFLNEVYKALGIRPTKAGNVVGWIYDPDNPKHKGNNYVDFGIYETNRQSARRFVNGYERTILLDFNVDGPILDDFEKYAHGVD